MRAAEITRQAADALTVAHEMGIVHRDLKPDNIMIAKNRDGSDCVKVVDFGIAKAADNQSQKVTRTGLVVGTPEYMSPEQLAGDKLDGRSDVYSLALVAFHMLTGMLPFPSDTAQESMIMRLTDKPRSLDDMKPDSKWPPAVQAVMDRALERDAKLRYQTANEFGRALFAALATMPMPDGTLVMSPASMAVPPTRLDGAPPVPPVKRRRRRPILIAVALMSVVGAWAAYVAQNGNAAKVAAPPATRVVAAVRPDSTAPWGPDSALSAQPPAAAAGGEGTQLLSTNLAGTGPKQPDKPTPAAASNDMESRVAALVTRSGDSLAALQVLSDVRALQPRAASNTDRAGLGLARAQALAFRRREDEACKALRSVQSMSVGTRYQSDIDRLLQLSC
jgi:serine/threonine-protein kinase